MIGMVRRPVLAAALVAVVLVGAIGFGWHRWTHATVPATSGGTFAADAVRLERANLAATVIYRGGE